MAAPESTTSKRKITAAERTKTALELRKGGATIRQIASVLNISPKAAHDALKRGLKQLNQDNVEEARDLRNLEAVRLDAMFMAIWPKALAGSHQDVDRALRIMDRRARLFGLDQETVPEKVEDLDAVALGRELAEQMDAIDALAPQAADAGTSDG